MTNHAIMLAATGPFEKAIDKKTGARLWAAFLAGGTSHSRDAATLPYIIKRCERTRTNYNLKAQPGFGYFIEPGKS